MLSAVSMCACPVSAATRVAFAAEAVSVYEGETAVVKLAANGLLTGDIAVYLLSSGAVCESCMHMHTLPVGLKPCCVQYCAYWHV